MEAVSEKRRFPRLSIFTDVTYVRSSISEAEKSSLTRNISEGGICFIAYEKLNQGEALDVEISMPEESAPVAATGKVVWIKEFAIGDPQDKRYDVGFEFIKIGDGDRKRIEKCVATNLPMHTPLD